MWHLLAPRQTEEANKDMMLSLSLTPTHQITIVSVWVNPSNMQNIDRSTFVLETQTEKKAKQEVAARKSRRPETPL